MLLVFFLLFNVADAVYFTMTDIRVTIPTDRKKLPPENHPLTTLYVQDDEDIGYTLGVDGEYMNVSSSTSDLVFTSLFKENIKKLEGISASITVKDSIGRQNRTSLTIDMLPLEPLDCDFIIEDLCYWKSARYSINENTRATLIGSLTSPYLAEMCPSYKINYYPLGKNDHLKLVQVGNYWAIQTTKPLDREAKNLRQLEVLCTVENPQRTVKNVTRNIPVVVMDVDDNPPEAQEEVINVAFPSNVVLKDKLVEHKYLIFHDKDSPAVNEFKPTVLRDPLGILAAECNKFENDLRGLAQTAVHCKLRFTRNMQMANWTYSVVLQLNDTTLIHGNKVVEVPIHLHFHNESGYHPATIKRELKPPIIYPSNTAKVFRTAAPLARITQPVQLQGAKHFTVNTNQEGKDIFNVTFMGGILFVHDSGRLRQFKGENLRVNISWLKSNKRESDEIQVRIVDEPTKTCWNKSSNLKDWEMCSENETPDDCLSAEACAISTGGSSSVAKREGPKRCMWRGDKLPSKQLTNLYATCTPDVDTCPDGVCDPLEQLHHGICPQDCTDQVLIPTKINPKTGHGIDIASGVCHCDSMSCSCNPMKMKKKTTTTTTTKAPNIHNQTFQLQGNVSKQISNHTGNILAVGMELPHCGTTCVLGIVAGTLFLGGAVGLVVVCWRLDRVQKAVRGKFSEESHDLSAPLSNYIDRNVPDPLPLSFDMTTSLADTAILNIINKYTPDPKWEFPRSQLIIEQTLGEGEFGRVLRAKALNIAGQTGQTAVAVKTLKDDARETELNDLLSEYQLLKEVSHPNVIRLLGVCTSPGGPIYLIIEFAEHGSLRNYLRRSRHLKSECGRLPSSTGLDDHEIHYDEPNVSQITPKEILSFAWQICKGMAYLSEIKLVHRDLAARNVLLAADKICKISDFGLTRDIYEDDAYFKRSKGRVPVKWMAPESLSDHVYTNKSDVWSFGILIWELVTLGATPYPGIAVQNLFHLLRQGYRMERPDNCSSTLYNIMRSCWHIDAEQRPSFQELSSVWEKMLSDEVEYLDLTNNAIHNRSYFCSPFEDNSSDPSEKSDTNPLNYLSKSQSYVKCGQSDKFPETAGFLSAPDSNQNNTQGYETPVKVAKKVQTPTNDAPQYYTDMAAGKTN